MRNARWTTLCCALVIAASQVTSSRGDETLEPRTYNGTGNNLAWPTWGSAGTLQIRSVAGAEYANDTSTPPGEDRPSAREVLTDVFLSSTAAVSTKSALFVAWGQLVTYDLALTIDNASEPFDVPCDDGGGVADVWCPFGAASDEISFNRSAAATSGSVRSPINYATSYLDLDFLYGRSEEAAEALRTLEGGFMNVTESGVPHQNADNTWLIADQRSAKFPVTFALHIMLLMEHNRCCVDVAPGFGYEGDEDVYQACRAWTIGVFQHITENDFLIMLLGSSMLDSVESKADDSYSYRRRSRQRRGLLHLEQDLRSEPEAASASLRDGLQVIVSHPAVKRLRSRGVAAAAAAAAAATGFVETGVDDATPWRHRENYQEIPQDASELGPTGPIDYRRFLPAAYDYSSYNESINVGADVFFAAAGTAALESALPATLRIVSEGFVPTDDDNIELTVAAADMTGLFQRNGVASIIRGAVLSPASALDANYAAAVSNLSPLFKLPVDAVQRGRDHGLPTYNEAREAYKLDAASDFSGVTSNVDLAALLSAAYDGEIDNLDALTGGLAEDASTGAFGPLLRAAWVEQLLRTIYGDRLHHSHKRGIENLELTTLAAVIERAVDVTDLPLSVFYAAGVDICGNSCGSIGEANVTLSDSFAMAWEELDDENILITLRAKSIGDAGMLGIGWGGSTMYDAQDYVICEVLSATDAECIDRTTVSSRTVPPEDDVDPNLEVTSISVGNEWTEVQFVRPMAALDDQDYDLLEDIEGESDTEIIYAFREGAGVGQHPNANRGAASVNFATGVVESTCDENLQFVSLHGGLMLIAWLGFAPAGLYFIRYRKGETVRWAGLEWFEMHEEIMIVASEAVLPLGITAVFASGGTHDTEHAHWGYYMITAVAMQVLTGWIRVKGLEAKGANFSIPHRLNKYFHIWAGRFAFAAGVVQCYRGLELVSSSDNLILSAGDGLDLELGSFGWVQDYVFPAWFAALALCFVFFETRKQWQRYFKKGSAKGLGCFELVNEQFRPHEDSEAEARLMPRTEVAAIYTMAEFNDKVLNGQSWVLVDNAILDVSGFAQRHPGGARLIMNAVGTDVTHELLGESSSVGHVMSFSPHTHPESAWEIARSLVVGYIDEEEDQDREQADDRQQQQEEEDADRKIPTTEGNKRKRKVIVTIAGKTLLLPTGKAVLGQDPLRGKARRLNDLATVPEPKASISVSPPSRQASRSSRRMLLERFHVCPLLFREKMGASYPQGADLASTRPVYRYVFRCPGPAAAMVEAITGVCYLNMRATDGKKGIIQRAYNAYAVRVQEAEPTPAAAAAAAAADSGRRRRGRGRVVGPGTFRVVPARETSDGALCIEMRIRLYHDGAMSKILEYLAHDTDNPAVQLQGPFIIDKLVPPPVYRKVVMVAAGTGINPMVQLARDYLGPPRKATDANDEKDTSRGQAEASVRAEALTSQLVLLWQSTRIADLYGSGELREMQATSASRLEVTTLISGEHRKMNIPQKLATDHRVVISPEVSPRSEVFSIDISHSSGSHTEWDDIGAENGFDEGIRRSAQVTDEDAPKPAPRSTFFGVSTTRGGEHEWGRGDPKRPRRLHPLQHPVALQAPSRKQRHSSADMTRDASIMRGGLVRGKVTRAILETAIGRSVLKRATSQTFAGEEQKSVGNAEAPRAPDEAPRDLQVVVSGPNGFVVHVESILGEMGVPADAIVLLD